MSHIRYGQTVALKICERLARGESLFQMANTEGMPCCSSFYVWQRRHPEFAEAVAQAREAGADYLAGRALEVAAASTKDTVQQDRLFVQTLMKHAALKAPRTWGGKGGSAKEAPKPQQVEVIFRVRHFEKAIGPDGKAFVREILPEDEA
ncbi:MAG: hypothetical protein KKE02_09940 [Alphaproteobacteria bacterium]|nr:hypothetical protein [Alphaproteobacteria bacterium]MBU1516868.1 hypothetical protein [Alphaproteobacteria bacterium]MBU2092563.1 hypothetical protein [Alphaproteobacteria bacterium]MBU2151326.1 hypothetical protein [Alphaproteobacteria bacterium]MBU2309628.1 hypothetical protein [Alphaproteobacteria bacterium]